MIAGIEGILVTRAEYSAVVDVHGVSFLLNVPAGTLASLGAPGSKVRLHTHLQVREDGLNLFGFATLEELKAFQLLIGVSGVGPRVALMVLSVMPPERFALAVATGDTDAFACVSGVGKKTAARIILDLKGKLEQDVSPVPTAHEDVRTALIGLGYSASEAAAAAGRVPDNEDLSLEDKIKLALRHFAKSG